MRSLTGAEAHAALPDIARLRISVFRDWPYLYDGDPAYEAEYLAPFAASPNSVLAAAYDDGVLVGAATGAPMEAHQAEFAAPLQSMSLDAKDVFYCAESVLLPKYRGHGLGHRFFDIREAQARALGRQWSVFCSVIRPADHPLRPADYRALDPFWRGRGYAPINGITASFPWKDLGETEETPKALQVWMRDLRQERPRGPVAQDRG